MPSKNQEKLSNEQKQLISEQLASFFFDFWQKRNLDRKAVLKLCSGLKDEKEFNKNK